MRTKRLLVAVTICCAGLTGAAVASHVAQVDASTVPAGFLAAHNEIDWIGLDAIARAVKPDGAEVFVQSVDLGPNVATPWHTHPGPVFVTVAEGSLMLETAKGSSCLRRVVPAGKGFFDGGDTHRVVAGAEGAAIYATYLLPKGSAHHITPLETPDECA